MERQDRADEIVNEVFAPSYNRYVEEGKIRGWAWLEHAVGGKWRRLFTCGERTRRRFSRLGQR